MILKKFLTLITKCSLLEIKDNKDVLLNYLYDLGYNSFEQEEIYKKIFLVKSFYKNLKTAEHFISSYLRIYSRGIYKDGRDSSAIIEITKRCNKKCPHCYSRQLTDRMDMDDDVLYQIISLVRDNYKHVFITGGDPILDIRVFNIAEKNPDIVFFMFSNGSNIIPQVSEKLGSLGNLIPMLSIDGRFEKTQDYLRNQGSYREIEKAISLLNNYNVSWGFISIVTNINAREVLSKEFITDKKEKGAIIGRYLEYLPVGPKAIKEFILSGENYYFLEKRKKEIIKNNEIYIQETSQDKCQGLLFFDVDGNIKNCPFMHYSKYNVNGNDLKNKIKDTIDDWSIADYKGECPIYSNPVNFKDHLLARGWRNIAPYNEEYLNNINIYNMMIDNYHSYLKLREEEGL